MSSGFPIQKQNISHLQIYISSSSLYMLVDCRPQCYRLIFMVVSTLAGTKSGAQRIKCKRLLDKSRNFQNLYKVNIYTVKQKNTVLVHTLFVPEVNNPPPYSLAFFFKKFLTPYSFQKPRAYQELLLLGNTCKSKKYVIFERF